MKFNRKRIFYATIVENLAVFQMSQANSAP
jgi:hypothetical protein